LEQLLAAGLLHHRLERFARAEPGRDHQAHLRPAEVPRDGADARHRAGAALAVRRTGAEVNVRELAYRRCGEEQLEHRRLVVDQAAERDPRLFAELLHRRPKTLFGAGGQALAPVGEMRHQRAGQHHF
jgi:hypothetical protein